MSRWVVHVKGDAGRCPFEIAVLRDDNAHGRQSYGWFGPDKILISHNGGPCRGTVPQDVWHGLVALAYQIAQQRNEQES